MDLDQHLDRGPKTQTISSDPSGHSPLPDILRNQAAKHLAAFPGRTQLTTSDGRNSSDLKAFTFQFADIEAEDGRRLVRVLHGPLNQHFDTLSQAKSSEHDRVGRSDLALIIC